LLKPDTEVELNDLQHLLKKLIKIKEKLSYKKNLDIYKKTSFKILIKWLKLMMIKHLMLLMDNLVEEKIKKESIKEQKNKIISKET
jgi:hypothetical protein